MPEALPSWVLEPLLPGDWFEVGGILQRDFFARVSRLKSANDQSMPLEQGRLEKVRFLELSFFKEWLLCEVQVNFEPGLKGLVSLLYGPHGLIVVNGKSQGIHTINRLSLKPLDAAGTGPAYLRFFCSAIRGEKGRFQIVEPESPFSFHPDSSESDCNEFRQRLEPVKVNTGMDSVLSVTALSIYDGGLYRCKFEIQQNGTVMMLEDEELCIDIPLCSEEFQGPFRIWKKNENSSK